MNNLTWRNCDEDDSPELYNLIKNSSAVHSAYDGEKRWDIDWLEEDMDGGSQWQCLEVDSDNDDAMVAAIRYNIKKDSIEGEDVNIFQVSLIVMRDDLTEEQKITLLKGIVLKVESMASHYTSDAQMKQQIHMEFNQHQAVDFLHEILVSKSYRDSSGYAIETDNDGEVVMIIKYVKDVGNDSIDDLFSDFTIVEDDINNAQDHVNDSTQMVDLVESLFTALRKEYNAESHLDT